MSLYTVIGRNPVDGHETGETYEEDMDTVKEARLTAGGHIARAHSVPGNSAGTEDNETGEEDGEPAELGEA